MSTSGSPAPSGRLVSMVPPPAPEARPAAPSGLAALLGIDERSLRAARWLAWRAFRAGQTRRAGDILAGCVALHPGDGWSWRLLAEVHLREGRAAEAWQAADRAAACGIDAVWMGWMKARARLAGGDPAGARQELLAARNLRGSRRARRAVGSLLRRWSR